MSSTCWLVEQKVRLPLERKVWEFNSWADQIRHSVANGLLRLRFVKSFAPTTQCYKAKASLIPCTLRRNMRNNQD